ncbi:hypothetical protein ACFLXD_07115 [Chloroflexota bacterium]
MAEKLGEIKKPPADNYQSGRKLYFIPLLFCGAESPPEYLGKFNTYWDQVKNQINDLELKLGKVNKIYHELVPSGGEGAHEIIKELNDKSYQLIKACLDKGAQLEAIEETELLTEFMDWSRCLTVGLQNQQVLTRIYEAYLEVDNKRNQYITGKIDETLQADEIGILLMKEGHQVQFPQDIQVFYVAPPALDEIKRWLRDRQAETTKD